MKYKEHFELIRKPMTECNSSLSLELELKQVKPFDFSELNLVDTNIVESINKKVYENLGIAEDTLTLREALFKASIYDKLSKDLGCPLEVFFKILKEKRFYFKYEGKVYFNDNCYINNVYVNSGFISISVANKELIKKGIFDVKLYFKDYKNTWWLKENREE